jgi:hypothetical protein
MTNEQSLLKEKKCGAYYNLYKRFQEGLARPPHNMKMEDLNNWKYCGGNSGSHYNYFKLCFPILPNIPFEDFCVCGVSIHEQCYITDGNKFIVVGNVCIKNFLEKSGRTCEECASPHRNSRDNFCNECRKKRKSRLRRWIA